MRRVKERKKEEEEKKKRKTNKKKRTKQTAPQPIKYEYVRRRYRGIVTIPRIKLLSLT